MLLVLTPFFLSSHPLSSSSLQLPTAPPPPPPPLPNATLPPAPSPPPPTHATPPLPLPCAAAQGKPASPTACARSSTQAETPPMHEVVARIEAGSRWNVCGCVWMRKGEFHVSYPSTRKERRAKIYVVIVATHPSFPAASSTTPSLTAVIPTALPPAARIPPTSSH